MSQSVVRVSQGTSPALFDADAAACTVQSWFRRRLACQQANRLLLWLHLLSLGQSMRNVRTADTTTFSTLRTEETTQFGTSSAIPAFQEMSDASDAAVLSSLLNAVYEYEEAKQNENYTRALLVDELLLSSTAVQSASAEARHRLRQQHAAVRHLSLSSPLAEAALKNSGFSAQSDQQEHQRCKSETTSHAADVLREVEMYLGTVHFAWWRGTIEGERTPAEHADVASGDADIRMNESSGRTSSRLAALHTLQTSADNVDQDEDLDVFTEQPEEVDEMLVAAAYAQERAAADAAAYEAAKRVTLAGCPDSRDRTESSKITAEAAVQAVTETPSATAVGDAEFADVQFVVQPVLGRGFGGQWHRSGGESGPTNGDPPPTSLICAVCELDGVLLEPDASHWPRGEGDEDVLMSCASCGALVHEYCACTNQPGGRKKFFCCSHCCSARHE